MNISTLKDAKEFYEQENPDMTRTLIGERAITCLERLIEILKILYFDYKGGLILDLGIDSLPVAYFSSNNIVGVDYLWNWKEKFPLVNWIKGTFEHLPFQDRKIFEWTIWLDGPEHSFNPVSIIATLSKVTEKLIFSCPYKEAEGVNALHFQSNITEETVKKWISNSSFSLISLKMLGRQLLVYCRNEEDVKE